jgi:hypothetical protein
MPIHVTFETQEKDERKVRKLKRSLKVAVLLGTLFFLWGCATEKEYVRDEQLLPPLSLYPCPLKGNFIIDEQTAGCEKEGIAVEESMKRLMVTNFGMVYVLKLRITNLRPSVLEVNPKQVFARRADKRDSFNTVTGVDLIHMIRDEASQDYAQSLRDKATYDSVMHGAITSNQGGLAILGYMLSKKKEKEADQTLGVYAQFEDLAKRDMIFFTQLPREGSVEGFVLFFPKSYPFLVADDLIVQLYLEGEEFVFRFKEFQGEGYEKPKEKDSPSYALSKNLEEVQSAWTEQQKFAFNLGRTFQLGVFDAISDAALGLKMRSRASREKESEISYLYEIFYFYKNFPEKLEELHQIYEFTYTDFLNQRKMSGKKERTPTLPKGFEAMASNEQLGFLLNLGRTYELGRVDAFQKKWKKWSRSERENEVEVFIRYKDYPKELEQLHRAYEWGYIDGKGSLSNQKR